MTKFIEVDNTIINIDNISEVNFISDDIYLGLFPKNDKGEILIDFITFKFAEIKLFTGEKIEITLDLYPPEESEAEGSWLNKNRAYINMSWGTLLEALYDITTITGFEYKG